MQSTGVRVPIRIWRNRYDRLDFTFKWPRAGATIPGRLQKLLRAATVAHREALLAQWESKVVVAEDY